MAILARKKKRKLNPERQWRETGSSIASCLFRASVWISNIRWSMVMKIIMGLFVVGSLYAAFTRKDPNDPFARPFCDAKGVCHEKADFPSPRTAYSAWNKEQYHLWWTYYEQLTERVDSYAKKRQKMNDNQENITVVNENTNHTRTRPLILLGDSITESWSGTRLGIHKKRVEGIPQILEDMLKSSVGLDPIVLGASGDQTQHLLYRLQNDHMRAAKLKTTSKEGDTVDIYDSSAIFVVMIGTNNLGAGELPGPTAKGILAVANYLLKETAEAGCHVMLFQVLPRGDGRKNLPKLCPPRCSDDENRIPYSSFLPAINKTNEAVAEGIEELAKTHPGRIKLVDCGLEFMNESYDGEKSQNIKGDNNYEVIKELMPDLLHPNVMGHRKLAHCMRDYINELDAVGNRN